MTEKATVESTTDKPNATKRVVTKANVTLWDILDRKNEKMFPVIAKETGVITTTHLINFYL